MNADGHGDIWMTIAAGIERDGDRAARSHLDAGFPSGVDPDLIGSQTTFFRAMARAA